MGKETNTKKNTRKPPRLKKWNYAHPAAYFVTICAHNKKCVFGDVRNGEMALNNAGRMVERVWDEIPAHFPHVELDVHIVMPNHVHGVIIQTEMKFVGAPLVGARRPAYRAGTRPAPTTNRVPDRTSDRVPTRTLGEIVGAFKSMSTNEYIRNVKNNGWRRFNTRLWQRNYYDHVVRDEHDLTRIREYIVNNPAKWSDDEYYAG